MEPQFIQLGKYIINLNMIAHVEKEDDKNVLVFFSAQSDSRGEMQLQLGGDLAKAFLNHINGRMLMLHA